MTEKPPRPTPAADLFAFADPDTDTPTPSPREQAGKSPQQALTPAGLNRLARQAIEQRFGRVWITGEVSGFSRHPASGHCYFSLKDAQASVSCAWFRRQIRPGQHVQNGDRVLILGQISLYEARGAFQVIVQRLEAAGQGDLHQEFLRLKKRLEELGLFDARFKKPLPARPQRIAIVTSRSGAAVQDVLKTIARRNPLLEFAIFHAAVQGENAPEKLMAALEAADQAGFDAILLTRGGGSLEDLWAFNHEGLAHTLFTLQTPVVSAVGHERDFTIADFVADARAATPTAGAELLSPDLGMTRLRLRQQAQRLNHAMLRTLHNTAQAIDQLETRLFRAQPGRQTAMADRTIRQLNHRLSTSVQQSLKSQRHTLEALETALSRNHPQRKLVQQKQRLERLCQRLQAAAGTTAAQAQQTLQHTSHRLLRQIPTTDHWQHRLSVQQSRLHQAWKNRHLGEHHRLQQLEQALEKLSPLKVLERGYSITQNARTGAVITDASQVQAGEHLLTRLHVGRLVSQVKETHSDEAQETNGNSPCPAENPQNPEKPQKP